MLPRNHPDGIHIAFDDHRLVNNAGLILPATLALRLGLPQLLRKHLALGGAPRPGEHRRQDDDPGGLPHPLSRGQALAGGDCIDDADVLRAGADSLHPGQCGQGALHPGHLPAQLQVGPCPPTGPGEPPSCWPGPGRRGPDPATRHSPSTLIRPSARPPH